ncbi:hypothetical protein Nepgr_005661 [Nepenthes gracilis]|uniref:Myb/SANT-like DNA-binding domain-containing protein n=1 Tax=Nepenthes gracilis TaxID=150966 RepID=A0AAD3XGN1_NEPGR|nr:hypothetical protein Nepgr_005661 [Nepenthes gracilis]
MEEDEETQSHPSPGSDSRSSPHHNGRTTVTVAEVLPRRPQKSLTLALPIQQPLTGTGGGEGGGCGGREDCWSEGATSVLIDAWGERYLELSRGNLKQTHWKEVADIVNSRVGYKKAPKTDIQCKNRIDTVKKKYKIEKAKRSAGGDPSKWPFFDRLERLIGTTAKIAGAPSPSPSPGFDSQKAPVGIPVRLRSLHRFQQQQQQQNQKQELSLPKNQSHRPNSSHNKSSKHPFRRPSTMDSESEPEEPSTDSFPLDTYEKGKRPRTHFDSNGAGGKAERGGNGGGGGRGGGGKEREKLWVNSVTELTGAVLKFGEAYEKTETAKLQQLVEMEKQRMKFAKELELQRMKFLMKTRLEFSQLGRKRKIADNHHHRQDHSNNSGNNNHSDSSN